MAAIVKSSAVLLVALLALSACETIHGLGQDTQKLGNDISTAAARNK